MLAFLDQIEIWFSRMQRQLLSPTHFASLEELDQAIEAFIAYYNEEARPLQWTYTVEKLEEKSKARRARQAALSRTAPKPPPVVGSPDLSQAA